MVPISFTPVPNPTHQIQVGSTPKEMIAAPWRPIIGWMLMHDASGPSGGYDLQPVWLDSEGEALWPECMGRGVHRQIRPISSAWHPDYPPTTPKGATGGGEA